MKPLQIERGEIDSVSTKVQTDEQGYTQSFPYEEHFMQRWIRVRPKREGTTENGRNRTKNKDDTERGNNNES